VPWKLTVRAGPRVERSRYESLEEALRALEARAAELAGAPSRAAVDMRVKRFEPAQLIAGRVELAGPERIAPTVLGGVDVHGDGSTEAYLGRVRRRTIERRRGESSVDALRRAVTTSAA
jgi:hypothetical protein